MQFDTDIILAGNSFTLNLEQTLNIELPKFNFSLF